MGDCVEVDEEDEAWLDASESVGLRLGTESEALGAAKLVELSRKQANVADNTKDDKNLVKHMA